ncbi:transcription factor grauzone-like [Phlebotomus papatasi]|uniref:transcription factor grauzone-like n=1 Tax=Phlebotomus papatasi TaxID=29031 RepID=UPI002483BCEF|nr:transcription factor grauzone-like [Phlebotomus papatasi]
MSFLNSITDFKCEIKTEIVDYNEGDELCRFCVERVTEYSSIIEKNLHESLTLHLGIIVQETDNWPKFICNRCLGIVEICLNFMTTVRNSEIILRDLYGEPGECVAPMEPIGIKSDFELIDVKDIPLDSESTDWNFDQNFNDSSCNALEGLPEPVVKKRGRPKKNPSGSAVDDEEWQTIPSNSKGNSTKTPLNVEENPEDDSKKPRRRSLNDLKEEDEIISQFFELKCSICSEPFETFLKLKAHTLSVHNEEAIVVCCDRELKNRTRLVNHLNSHINPNKFKCTQCDSKGFLTETGLNLHILSTHSPRELHKFKCEKCPRTFITGSRLNRHQHTHLEEKEKNIKCPQCDKAFSLDCVMKAHLRTHDESAKFICEICAKIFKTKCDYNVHMKDNHSNTAAPKFCCPKCGKMLKKKKLLQIHIERHNEAGEIFKCNMCGKEAPNRFALKNHIQFSHIKVRKYACHLCGKAFKKPLGLKEHIATHSASQMLYTCLFCPKQFNSNANKYTHQKRRHPIEYMQMKQNKNV